MKIVILGGKGQLGTEIYEYLKDKEEIYSFSHQELDILDYDLLEKKLREIKPDLVINCSAYTKVDKAEEEKDECIKVNTIGAKYVSFLSYKIGAKIVYFSTDYIFDGEKNTPYTEFDDPNPLSVYGLSKLYGEKLTMEHNPNHLILRISWLYGIYGRNFVKTVLNLAREKKKLTIVNDQKGSPTYTLDVAKQVYELIKKDKVGIYHSSNQGETTWCDFAKRIIEILKIKDVEVLPIKTEEYPSIAKRPKYSVLDNFLLKLEGINIMRDWEIALEDFLNTYKDILLGEKE